MSTIFDLKDTPLARLMAGYRREFMLAGFFSAVANLLMLTPTIYMLQVYDRVMISRSELTLAALTIVLLAMLAVLTFSEWIRSKLIIRAGVKLDEAVNDPLFRATFHRQLAANGGNPGQVFSDLTSMRQWLTSGGVYALFDVPWIPLYLIVIFMLHPFLGAVSVIFLGVLAAIAWLSARLTRQLNEESLDEERELNQFIHGKMRNAEVIEAHGMLASFREQWWRRQISALQLALRASDAESRVYALTKETRLLLQSLSLGAGAILVIQGELTVGAMIAVNLLMSRATSPLDTLVAGWKGLLSARDAFNSINGVLEKYPAETSEAVQPVIGGALELRDILIKVPGRERPILSIPELRLQTGQIYTITGPSGSGKSTFGKVLLGVWPGLQGDVLVDGHSLAKSPRETIGDRLGYLPQGIELFEGTVAENIARLGSIESEAVIDAATQAGMHKDILHLPRGYETPIGEAGGYLSGGQRQRIALARALYGKPDLIVLDEPNANLDHAGDTALVDAIRGCKERGATVFLISHRTNVIGTSDYVIAMRDGQVESISRVDAGSPGKEDDQTLTDDE